MDDHRTAYSLVENLRDDFIGAPADAFFTLHQEMAGKARLALQQFGDHTNLVRSLHDQLHNTRTAHSQNVANTLGQVPETVWEFLGDRATIPTLADVTMLGENAAESLLAVWDRHVPAQMPAHQSDPVTGFLHWTYDHTIGAIGAEVGNLFQAIVSWGLDLGIVRGVVGSVDALLHSFYANVQGIFQSHLTMAMGSPCSQKKDGDQQPLPPEPPASSLTHTKADLQQRAQAIYLHLSDPGGADILSSLQGLTPADIQELEYLYQKTYKSTLIEDIKAQGNLDPYTQAQIFLTIAPDSLTNQDNIDDSQSGATHIIVDPNHFILAPNVPVTYQLWDGAAKKMGSHYREFAVAGADAQDNGSPAVLNAYQLTASGFPAPGTYTVVVEDDSGGANKPPHYYTYQETVVSNDQAAEMGLIGIMMPPDNDPKKNNSLVYPDDCLTKLNNDVNAEKNLATKNTLSAQYQYLQTLLQPTTAGPIVPIPATLYAPQNGNSMVQLVLFAKPLPNGKWQVIDATDEQNIKVYPNGDPASSLDTAWEGFIQDNPYPEGQIAALPPTIPQGETNVSWTNWNKSNTDHSPLNTVWRDSTDVAAFFGAMSFLFPPFLFLAGAASLVHTVTGIWENASHGDWHWDVNDWLQIAQGLVDVGLTVLGAGPAAKFIEGLQTVDVAADVGANG